MKGDFEKTGQGFAGEETSGSKIQVKCIEYDAMVLARKHAREKIERLSHPPAPEPVGLEG